MRHTMLQYVPLRASITAARTAAQRQVKSPAQWEMVRHVVNGKAVFKVISREDIVSIDLDTKRMLWMVRRRSTGFVARVPIGDPGLENMCPGIPGVDEVEARLP